MDAAVQIALKITGDPLVCKTGVYQEEGDMLGLEDRYT